MTALPMLHWPILACLVLVVNLFGRGGPQFYLGFVALGLIASLSWDIAIFNNELRETVFSGGVVWDSYAQVFTIIAKAMVLVVTLTVFPVAGLQTKFFKSAFDQTAEFLVCLLLSGMGVSILASAADLTSLFLGLEIMSIGLYCLCGFYRADVRSTESGFKYLMIGAFSTAIFLYGVAFIYGATGETSYALIAQKMTTLAGDPLVKLGVLFTLAGLAFKLAFVPFHLNTADVYEGAPTPVTGYLATIVKVGVLAASLRLLWGVLESVSGMWISSWIALCALSIVIGNVVALQQRTMKKLLAFSSISHAGFMGLGLLVSNPQSGDVFPLMSYIIVYSAMSLGLFALLTYLENGEKPLLIEDLRGLVRKKVWVSLALGIFIFGLAGIPPFAGFMIKFWIFQALIEQGYWTAAWIGVLGSLLGAAYYLKVLMTIFISEEEGSLISYAPPRDPILSLRLVVIAATLLTLLGGVRPQLYAHWIFSTLALK